MVKGDIVLIPFPFTDLSDSKIRPALVLYVGEYDVTVSFISTKLHWKSEVDLILTPNEENGLKKESLVKLSKIATLDKVLIEGKLGNIQYDDFVELDENLIKLFEIENQPKWDKGQEL